MSTQSWDQGIKTKRNLPFQALAALGDSGFSAVIGGILLGDPGTQAEPIDPDALLLSLIHI